MGKKNSNEAFMRCLNLSEALEEVVGEGPMPRTEVTKKLWQYIKKHHRQDPKNKKMIIPDQKLKGVFGPKPIDMFSMSKKLSKHLD